MAGTVRISPQSWGALRELATRLGEPMQLVLDRAVECFRREQFLREVNEGFARLKSDPDAWAEELAEREAWDATLADGLNKE